MKGINELSTEIYENAKSKGFHDDDYKKNIGEMLCLIHSEVSEALEADRKDRFTKTLSIKDGVSEDSKIPMSGAGWALSKSDNEEFKKEFTYYVKDTFEDELADIMIRVMDLAAFKGIDLEAHIKAKMRYNSLREYKHGKKY